MRTILILLIISQELSTWGQQPAANPPNIGYMIVLTEAGNEIKTIQTANIAEVYAISEIQFPNNCVDFVSELKHSIYYGMENQQRGFYVEVKKINRRGKYRRMGNRHYLPDNK